MLQKTTSYVDIPFFITKNPFTNDTNVVKDVNAIKQALKNIVMTIKTERPFTPTFGANPRNILFDHLSQMTAFECKHLIANAINTFEPRVLLKDIGLQVSPINPNKLNIVVVYSITTTGFTDSLSISLERTR